MPSLLTLPAIWAPQPGEPPCPAHEAAAALLDLVTDARADAQPILAQLGAAADASPEAIALGVRLQELLAEAAEVVGMLNA
jgi:hypothetical protein